MKKIYLLSLFLIIIFPARAQFECPTAVTVYEGTNIQEEATGESFYWYEFTMPDSKGRLEIVLPIQKNLRLYEDCSSFNALVYASEKLVYLDAEPNQVLKIRIDGGNTESFEWTLSVSDFLDAEICETAYVAEEGDNFVGDVENKYVWYSFQMPDDAVDARIYFELPFLNSAMVKFYKGECDNFTDERNIFASSNVYTTGYEANEVFLIRIELNGERNFDWSIRVEVPETGQDCNAADIATLGENTIPETELGVYWYKYTTPSDVEGLKLQASTDTELKIGFYKNQCTSSAEVVIGNSKAFFLDVEPETNYFIRFYQYPEGDINWTLELIEPDFGDECSKPITVEEGWHQADFTPQWFSFVAPEDGTFKISSAFASNSVDTYLRVYDACGGDLIDENDDYEGFDGSSVTLSLEEGQNIIILWDNVYSSDGFEWIIYNASSQYITFNTLPAKIYGDDPFELEATASSGLAVSYTSSNPEVATVSGNTVTIVGAGETTITASQEGNDEYREADEVSRILTVDKALQTITAEEIADKYTDAEPFEVVASVDTDLELSYEILSGPASIDGSTVTLVGTEGVVTVKVSQDGNDNYLQSSIELSFGVTVNPCNSFVVELEDVIQVSCNGESDGAITVNISGGTGNYSYLWSNGATTKDIEGLQAGTYTLTVNDAGNCGQELLVTIDEPSAIAVTATITDADEDDGSIILSVSGGQAPYTFSWSNGETGAEIRELAAGDYSVTITDSNGCTTSQEYVIASVSGISETLLTQLKLWPNPSASKVNIAVPNALIGKKAAIINMSGRVMLEFELHTPQELVNIENLAQGLYMLSIDSQPTRLKIMRK